MRSTDFVDPFRYRWLNTTYESEAYRRWSETDRWYRELLSALEPNPATKYIWPDSSQSMTEVDELFYGSSPTPSKQLKVDDKIDLSFLNELL